MPRVAERLHAPPCAGSALGLLVDPLPEAAFLDQVWERDWRRYRPPNGLDWMLGPADLPWLLSSERDEGVKRASLGRMQGTAYQHVDIDDGSRIDLDLVVRGWREGFTLIVPELHRFWYPAFLFAQCLSRQTGMRAEMNLYYAPPEAITFPAHYDTHDVFVLQLFGAKAWRLYPSAQYLPLADEPFVADPGFEAERGSPIAELDLTRGDVVYLPRGVVHAAKAQGLPSLHVSIGLYPTLWRDLFLPGADVSGIDERSLRRGISPAYHRDPRPENAPAELRGLFQPRENPASRANLPRSGAWTGWTPA